MTLNKANSFEGKRILVTGGAGFVGSHLCESLLSKGASVIVADNFITGRKKNLAHLLENKEIQLMDADITQRLNIDGDLDGIFHMASPASPVDYARYPIETLRAGAMGADHILRLAFEFSCPVLIASTSEVYGDPLQHPQKESYWGNVNTIGPRGCYDESKRYQEALAMAYHRVHGVAIRIVRIFNTYGPRMRADDGRVVPNFCVQALTGEPLTVYGKGQQTRSFCYVDDLVSGIVELFCSKHPEPVNLGNPCEYTVLDFAKKIIALTDSDSEIVFKPLPADDPQVRCPDIARAERLLGWKPQVSIEDGLGRTIDYFREAIAKNGGRPDRPQRERERTLV